MAILNDVKNEIIAGSILLCMAIISAKNRLHDRINCFGHFYQDMAFSNVNTGKANQILAGRVKAFQPLWQSKRP